jgi:hypothetical protein
LGLWAVALVSLVERGLAWVGEAAVEVDAEAEAEAVAVFLDLAVGNGVAGWI